MKRIFGGHDDLVGNWVMQRTGGTWTKGRGVGIGLLDSDRGLIAGVVFDSWNGASVCMHVAAVPGSRWMTREYLKFCFSYPFEQLKVKKILGLVGSQNLAAQRFDEHLGFVLEATLNDAHPDGALLIYTMTAAQCRHLHVKVVSHGQAISSAAT